MFPTFHTMFTKKTQGISTNLFVLGRKFSDFAARASRTLRYFPNVSYNLDFSQLLDAIRRRLKFHINVKQGLRKTPKWVVRFSITVGLPSHPYFVPPIQVFLDLGCDYCI